MTPRIVLFWAFLCLACRLHGQIIPIFDDNPGNGRAYDPSDARATAPSTLRADGFSPNKLPLITAPVFRGAHAAELEWKSAAGGSWEARLSCAHWALRSVPEGSALVLQLNGPRAIPREALPRLRVIWENDSSSPELDLAKWLPTGVDGDTNRWQRLEIPLAEFQPTVERFRALAFFQGTADDAVTRTMWLDHAHFKPAKAAPIPGAPANLQAVVGDRVVNLFWAKPSGAVVDEYIVQRRESGAGDWKRISVSPVEFEAFVDASAVNGTSYNYRVVALNMGGESEPSEVVAASARAFRSDNEFLDYLQQTAFWYFWQQANPANGLVRDRSHPSAFSSIAATGFGLTALPIGIERGWVGRQEALERVAVTLRTFVNGPQGPEARGRIGHRGWFYHFLEMESGARFGRTELSSIDTALLLGGALFVREYFDGVSAAEREIRAMCDQLFQRVDWRWMTNGEASLTMGWHPESGFIKARWIGYNEANLIYILALGAAEGRGLDAKSWAAWTSGYEWKTSHGLSYLHFEPLFGHQYSHVWIDFRGIADEYVRGRGIDYFENSRRATLAQQRYAIANPKKHRGYGELLWGFTACDGPGFDGIAPYMARGTPPALNDDGTIAPTAAGGSIPFAPEICIPTLRNIFNTQHPSICHPYGMVDAFNLNVEWFDGETLGIDQGPILLMIENHRSGMVWKTFMKSPIIQRGLERAGFRPSQN